MKIIILFAFCVFVSSKPIDFIYSVSKPLNQSPIENKLLQELYDCRPGEKCADKIMSTKDNFPDAIEKACPKCSSEQKSHMAHFIDAISKGVSVEEAQKLYNPDNKYFDVVDNPDPAFTFDSAVNAS